MRHGFRVIFAPWIMEPVRPEALALLVGDALAVLIVSEFCA